MTAKPKEQNLTTPFTTELFSAESRGDDFHRFGKAAYLPRGDHGPRRQDVFFLIAIREGSVSIDCDGKNVELGPGQGVILPPLGLEFYRFDRHVKTIHTWCQVASSLVTEEEKSVLTCASKSVMPVPASVSLLIEEGLSVPINAGLYLNKAMRALAKACLLCFAAKAIEETQTPRLRHHAVRRAIEAIAKNPSKFRNAIELARYCGISYSRLRKLFHEDVGESPSAMIWRLKTEHAIQVIRGTGLTLSEIAEQCGFSNAFHLSRCVKSLTGMPPRNLRQIEGHTE